VGACAGVRCGPATTPASARDGGRGSIYISLLDLGGSPCVLASSVPPPSIPTSSSSSVCTPRLVPACRFQSELHQISPAIPPSASTATTTTPSHPVLTALRDGEPALSLPRPRNARLLAEPRSLSALCIAVRSHVNTAPHHPPVALSSSTVVPPLHCIGRADLAHSTADPDRPAPRRPSSTSLALVVSFYALHSVHNTATREPRPACIRAI